MLHHYSPSRSFSFRWPASWPDGLPTLGRSDFRSGREALFALAQHLKSTDLAQGKVLLPAWVPEGVQLPFSLAQWEIHYYNLDHNANPKWEEITQRLNDQHFDLVVLIHFFGQERDAKRMQSLLPPGSRLLEDWAHSYPHPQWEPPTTPHWALFSPTKMIGTTDGAWLIGPSTITPPLKVNHQHYAFLFWQLLYLAGSSAQQLNLPGKQWWQRLSGGAYARAYRHLLAGTNTPKALSKTGKWLIRHTPHNKVIEERMAQAAYYYEHLTQGKIRFLAKDSNLLHPPIGFPLWVDDPQHFSTYLQAHGIRGQAFTDRWWFIKEHQSSQYQSSKDLLEHHFLLPIHQRFTEQDLTYVVEVVNQYPGE
ncbi:MAG: hypothetical protein ACRBG0_04150 [Lewinella sp.]|uniref:hypothetical protein n=1 Tax=Lewinella sp. TaxID=2004506 RepID=UPI003D6AB374